MIILTAFLRMQLCAIDCTGESNANHAMQFGVPQLVENAGNAH
jgi:hypothetical protein